MKLSELLRDGIYVLKESNIEDCNWKARILLAYLLGKPKEYLMINDAEEIDFEMQMAYYGLLDRLMHGEPLQYITGKQEFMGLEFMVNSNVLIPQPDTEILVEAVIKYLEHNCGKENVKLFENLEKSRLNKPKILDLCTGSGAIAISLAKNLQNDNVDMVASDISAQALEVARINCQKNRAKVKLVQSDLFENMEEKFDMIVSNPPYIATEVISELSLDVQNEPHLALDGGEDGLDFYRKIGSEAKKYLTEEGMLFLEIGYDQNQSVRSILEKNGFQNVICLQDFAGNDRVMIASV
ncbi:MAG: peptide chain release factor N(5)-glutamine methyltransferase [Clostridia bacterium]|nr:peptide chain release factor N(5)-glutamine methyltransferase [Clostridia bacterium]